MERRGEVITGVVREGEVFDEEEKAGRGERRSGERFKEDAKSKRREEWP